MALLTDIFYDPHSFGPYLYVIYFCEAKYIWKNKGRQEERMLMR